MSLGYDHPESPVVAVSLVLCVCLLSNMTTDLALRSLVGSYPASVRFYGEGGFLLVGLVWGSLSGSGFGQASFTVRIGFLFGFVSTRIGLRLPAPESFEGLW